MRWSRIGGKEFHRRGRCNQATSVRKQPIKVRKHEAAVVALDIDWSRLQLKKRYIDVADPILQKNPRTFHHDISYPLTDHNRRELVYSVTSGHIRQTKELTAKQMYATYS